MNSNSNSMRLENAHGLHLERDKTISFKFDGKIFQAYQGDTIASALAANDVKLISRSFKYHRPRGILSMTGQDSNTLVQVGDEPNVRADTRLIEEGMTVTAQNVFGSLENDYGRFIELFSRFLPVGFYYKAFYKPKGAWKFWEPVIRRMAGLGKVDLDSKESYTDKQYRFTDVTVIGSGPAGLSAALEAANNGAQVLLVEEGPLLGGSLNYARLKEDYNQVTDIRNDFLDKIKKHENIEVLVNSQCTGWFDDNWLSIVTSRRLLKLRSQSVVVATGSFEQPAIFRNNDLPGVMLGSAAQRLIRLYGVQPGQRAVILTANDDGYGVALDLIDVGVEVAAIVEMRNKVSDSKWAKNVVDKNIEILTGQTVFEVYPGSGKRSIKGVCVADIVAEGQVGDKHCDIACDLLCMSVGYSPAAQLLCHSGGRMSYDKNSAMLKIHELPRDDNTLRAVAAGSLNAVFDLDAVILDGKHAGWSAARMAKFSVGPEPQLTEQDTSVNQNYDWPIFSHPGGKEFVDFDEDLQIKDITDAVAEGYDDLELVKRYSTVVMGPSQGRQSALNNLRIATKAAQKTIDGLSITTQRPPFYPEPVQILAGRSFQPLRRTSMHHRHLEQGAVMMTAGAWLRPAYYGNEEQSIQHIKQEALAVRQRVGLVDVSTLGKLEVRGPDAAEFMNRMYTFAYVKQPVNRSRYVLMTDETGVIIDDGVACRMREDHFYVTATTGGVDNVYQSMLRWNTQWRLDVDIANVTSAYAAVNLAGPKSREVLESISNNIDLSPKGFAYMEVRTGDIAGIPARLLRVGFVGELGYEIHVPAGYGEALWDVLIEAGREFDLLPFGVEAQRLLRLEKGHIIIGQDTDGLTTPEEANMSWAIARKKPFHIGKRSVELIAEQKQKRCLVGFTLPASYELPKEANLTLQGDNIAGRVTSVSYSPALDKIIGLAYVLPEQSEVGTKFDIKLSSGQRLSSEVCTVPFYDPDNLRQEL